MSKTETPLVSICTTFRNSEKFITRFVTSCLAQTYQNIEVILVDECSTDKSEDLVKNFTARDHRVRYFKIEKPIGMAACVKKIFEFAEGEFVIFPGVDDWLSKDFISRGVKDFEAHPNAAGVVPTVVTLHEVGENQFKFLNEFILPSGIYGRDWILKKFYREPLTLTQLSLVRRKDAVASIDYFINDYCNDSSLFDELKKLYGRAWGVDIIFFLAILKDYKEFMWDNSMNYIKILHSSNVTFGPLAWNSVSGILRYYYYHFLAYSRLYKFLFPLFYPGMKTYVGAEALATVLVHFAKSGFRPSFFDVHESLKQFRGLFNDFNFPDILKVAMFLPVRMVRRLIDFIGKKVVKGERDDMRFSFNSDNFLDESGYFKE